MTETDFFEGGAKSLSFGKVNSPEAAAAFGRWRGGPIEHIGEARQQTNWESGELEFWNKSGDPIMQLPITMNTAAGQYPEPPIDGDDDLVRTYYCTKGKQEFRALRDALSKAGVKAPAVGGVLYVRWFQGVGIVSDGRKFEFVYYPPQGGADQFLNGGQQPPAQQSPMPPQVPQGAPQQAPPQHHGGYATQTQMPPQQQAPGPYPQQPSGAYGASASVAGHPGPDSYPAAQFDPTTGQPVHHQGPQPPAAAPEQPQFDPATGAPLNDAARAVLAQHQQPAQQSPMPPQHPTGVGTGGAPAPQQAAPTNPYAQ